MPKWDIRGRKRGEDINREGVAQRRFFRGGWDKLHLDSPICGCAVRRFVDMCRFVLLSISLICISLTVSCANKTTQGASILQPQLSRGSIIGSISPINVYNAEITVLQDKRIVAVVGIQEGTFRIDSLPPGAYDLRVSALGYVTNNAIKDMEVEAGVLVNIGRAAIYPEDTGEFIPTRITGVVLDTSMGFAIVPASIKIECTERICGILEGVSDKAGRFAIAV